MWQWIEQKLGVIFGTLWDFIKPLLSAGIHDALNQLLPVALNIVAQIAKDPTVVSNDDKRNAALKNLQSYVTMIGISVGTSVLNTAIELAVQKLKTTETTAVPPPAA
jgi:hypothetical protein